MFRKSRLSLPIRNGVLNLTGDVTYDAVVDGDRFPNGVVINKTLIINGNGHIISGNNTYRIFYINETVTLNNITFVNGSASEYGGAIYTTAKLTINNSDLLNNTASNYGGAVYSIGALTVDNSNFEGNDLTGAKGGYAIYATNENVKVTNSNFTNNALSYTTGVQAYGAVTVMKGGVFDKCIFTNNAGRWGGAISGENTAAGNTITVNNSKFVNNHAYQGGAIFAQKLSLVVENCNFTSNNATDGGAIDHDAVKLAGIDASIKDSVFDSNTADRYGSAIYALSGFNYINCNFTNNKAISGTSTIYYFGNSDGSFADSVIDGCMFEDNVANYYGAVYFYGTKSLTVLGSQFINNTGSVYAGAILFYAKDLTIKSSNFTENVGKYGIVYYSGNGLLTVDDVKFESNEAEWSGALFIYPGNANISNSEFISNKATSYAGAIYTYNGNVNITDNKFSGNLVNGNPNSIYIWKSSVFLKNNTFFIKLFFIFYNS